MLNEFHTPWCVEFVKQITLESPPFRPSIHIGIGEEEDLRARHCSPNPTHYRLLSTYGTWTAESVQNSLSYAQVSIKCARQEVADNLCCSHAIHGQPVYAQIASNDSRPAGDAEIGCSIPLFVMYQFSKPCSPDSIYQKRIYITQKTGFRWHT